MKKDMTNNKERERMRELLYIAMEIALNETQREAMKLFLENKTIAETAEILGMSRQGADKALKTAQKKLLKIRNYV